MKKQKTEIKEDLFPSIKPDIKSSSDALVVISEEEFQGKFQETYYFQKFSEIERKPDLGETISDLMELFSGTTISMIEKQYKLYKNKSDAKVITAVWTCSSKITERINAAIVIDAIKTFENANFSDISYFKQVLK